MNKILFFSGILFFIGGIVLFKTNYYQINIENEGNVVNMKIVDLPNNCGTKSYYFVKYEYQNTYYEKRIKGRYCQEHYIGEIVSMRMLDGNTSVQFPSENATIRIYLFLLISVFGLIVAISYFKKAFPSKM